MSLNSFWGNMLSTAQQITLPEALGAQILSDPFSIQGAMSLNDTITSQFTQYLATLYAQGIHLPPETVHCTDALPDGFSRLDPTELASQVDSYHKDAMSRKRTKLAVVERQLHTATKSLAASDRQGYLSSLSKAVALNDLAHG